MKVLPQTSVLKKMQLSVETMIKLGKSNIPTCYEAENKLNYT
jgi:hypothetical protein